MRHIAVAAIFGIAIGATATHAILTSTSPDDISHQAVSPTVKESVAEEPALPELQFLVRDESGFSDRVGIFRFASRASLPELSSTFEEAMRLSPSAARRYLLGVLISRIAELDPDRALAILADQDMDQATARAMGLLLLDSLGTNTESIDAITLALPQLDKRRFTVSAIEQLAMTSPDHAIQLAIGINDKRQHTLAVRAVAALLAEQDPYAALVYSESIPDEPGVIFEPAWLVFQTEALRQLAQANLSSAIDYLNQHAGLDQSLNASQRLAGVVIDAASRVDPLTALELSKQLEGYAGEFIERSALKRLTRENPIAALGYTEGLPVGPRRQGLRQAIARVYGEIDPEGALSWARSLEPTSPEILTTVLDGVARVDPMRVLDLVLAGDVPTDPMIGGYGSIRLDRSRVLRAAMGLDGQPGDATPFQVPIADIGGRLLALSNEAGRNEWIRQFVSEWSEQDPGAALDWLQANDDRVGKSFYSSVARNMAERDPTAAVRISSQLPPDVRDEWVRTVVGDVASRDALGVLDWIAQFRGELVYEAGAATVVANLVGSHPTQALLLFDTLSSARQIESAKSLVASWNWQDSVAARGWVVSMPSGALRDSALSGLVSAGVGFVAFSADGLRLWGNDGRSPDAETMALFSSDMVRQEAIVGIISTVAARDQAEARGLIEQYLSDPVLLSQAEQRMRQARNYGR